MITTIFLIFFMFESCHNFKLKAFFKNLSRKETIIILSKASNNIFEPLNEIIDKRGKRY